MIVLLVHVLTENIGIALSRDVQTVMRIVQLAMGHLSVNAIAALMDTIWMAPLANNAFPHV